MSTRLYGPAAPSTSGDTLYTCTGTGCTITEILLINVTGSASELTIWLVPEGGTAGDSNQLVPAVTVPAHSIAILSLATPMNAGDFLEGANQVADAVNVCVSGDVILS